MNVPVDFAVLTELHLEQRCPLFVNDSMPNDQFEMLSLVSYLLDAVELAPGKFAFSNIREKKKLFQVQLIIHHHRKYNFSSQSKSNEI